MPPLAPLVSQSPSARARIVATAHDLFYRDGIRATGIDRVIAESGGPELAERLEREGYEGFRP